MIRPKVKYAAVMWYLSSIKDRRLLQRWCQNQST
ncbi:hypothetical protein E2C01_067006 [Portunus trituberculatus]|uniref:Uncharacterized protein n=1 Tax=Portunus trituberculatus TaxID=210409 RepID=A0A5B7HWC3_PORTR|nr:hypothetical protein [Portunus trituberculatus]